MIDRALGELKMTVRLRRTGEGVVRVSIASGGISFGDIGSYLEGEAVAFGVAEALRKASVLVARGDIEGPGDGLVVTVVVERVDDWRLRAGVL